jgi:hypothetical protein
MSEVSIPGTADGNMQTRKRSRDALIIVVTTYIAVY